VQQDVPRAQEVLVQDGGREIHGYAVGVSGTHVEVVWAVASGRQRRRSFPVDDVFLPSHSRQWTGEPIAAESLHLAAHANRIRAAAPNGNAAGHPHWTVPSDHAA
jgi:hypothetical protein